MKHLKLGLIIIVIFFASGCAYYNTFFNAKKYFKDAEKEREKRLERVKKQRQGSKAARRNMNRLSTAEIKNYNESIKKASKVLEVYPKSKYVDDALFLLGKCFFRKKEFSKAQRKFRELIENFPDSKFVPESRLWLGKTFIELRDYETAERIFHEILSTDVENDIRDEAQFLLGGLFKHKKDYVTAISEFQIAAKRARDRTIRAKTYFQMGECYLQLKNYEKAVDSFKKARKYTPDEKFEFDAMLQAGLAYKMMEKYDEAIKIFNNLLGDIVNEDNWPLCRLEIAHCYRFKGNMDTAIEWYLDIIDQHPKTVEAAEAYYYLGKIYQENKAEYEFAKEYYDKAPLENAKSEKAREARARSKSIEQLLELQKNIIAQQKRIAKGDSIAAVVEKLDLDEIDPNKSVLEFTKFDTLVARAMEIPLDSLGVYQDTLMAIYGVHFADFEERLEREALRDPKDNNYTEVKLTLLDSLMAKSMKLNVAYLEDYQDSLKNVYKRFYPTYKRNKLLYDLNLNQNKNDLLNNNGKSETPEEALVSAKLSLAEIFLFEFNQPDSALKEYLDILAIDTSRAVIPKTLYSIGYIAETFKKDTTLADSMFQRLFNEYPDDPLAQYARKRVKTIEIPDPDYEVALNFQAAEKAYLDDQNYEEALKTFRFIENNYPSSDYAPKSLLAMGWIYENGLNQLDSAFSVYSMLVEKYPNSVYAKQVQKKVEEVKRAKASSEKLAQAEQVDQAKAPELAEAVSQISDSSADEIDIASMDKEQYRRYLRAEMEKNDPRRKSPKRW